MLEELLEILKKRESVIDSRLCSNNTIFFAINSGNNYVLDAINSGSYVVCDDKKYEGLKNVFVVDNTVLFMQKLAKEYRKTLNTTIIAITGSNGKTTVKDILFSLLSKFYKTYKTQGNYNNHIGAPLTILNIRDIDDYAVVEIGTSNFGEIEELSKIVLPDYSIITNIGESHMQYFKTYENVFYEKTSLIKYTKKKVVLNCLDPYLKNIKDEKVIFNEMAENIVMDENGILFKLNGIDIKSNLLGKHNVINILLSLKIFTLVTNKTLNDALDIIKNLTLTNMRMQKIDLGDILLINDAYNASPKSMEMAINAMNYFKGLKVLVLADMLELGDNSIKYHENLSKHLQNDEDIILLYGDNMKYLYEKLKRKNVFHFLNLNGLVNELDKIQKPYTMLLKGSRGMKLEKILEMRKK